MPMSINRFQLNEFSIKTLEESQKWRDENYERNTKKSESPKLGTIDHE
jgi:hypothetical protein